MVAAGSSTNPHTRMASTNYGNRIDCYALGENIVTLGDGREGSSIDSFTSTFDGPSGAAAIIAGAAISVQGIMQSTFGYRLNPRQMRTILSNPLYGTASSSPSTDLIGVMPDLEEIRRRALYSSADIYIRDFVGDTGTSHIGAASNSPDIIVRPDRVTDPATEFGTPASLSSDTLGSEVLGGRDNYIYVRAFNRGASVAIRPEVKVYWSEVATLVTPSRWNLIDTGYFDDIWTAGAVKVSNTITWNSGSIPRPGTGHYCFVAIIGSREDPAPDRSEFRIWDNFVRFVKNNNNVAWRNFNIMSMRRIIDIGGIMPGFMNLGFGLSGADEISRIFNFEILSKLPVGARVFLEIPDHIVQKFNPINVYVNNNEQIKGVLIPIKSSGIERFEKIELPANFMADSNLWVSIPQEFRENEYEISISQFYEELEVGRITWRLTKKTE